MSNPNPTQHAQPNSKIESTIPSPCPNIQNKISKMNVQFPAHTHHTMKTTSITNVNSSVQSQHCTIISKVNVQAPAQQQCTQTNFPNACPTPNPHLSHENNFQHRCPILYPTHTYTTWNSTYILNPQGSPRIRETIHKSNLQSPGQSQQTKNEFQNKCQLPDPCPS